MSPSDESIIDKTLIGTPNGPSISLPEAGEQDDEVVYEPLGKVIAGRYTIDKPLGTGGMGSVYLAIQNDLQRRVAIKAMASDDAEMRERFRREAVALSDVSHPAIVEIHDFIPPSSATDERCYLVMAYVEGQNLEDYAASLPDRRMPVNEIVSACLPIASALVELHANGIIHRDLKPGNMVRFELSDGHSSTKLVDFGIARRQVDEGLTAAGFVLGTPAYMAPEAMVGTEKTPLGDVYALGATMFNLATGEPPYGAGGPTEVLRRMMVDEPPSLPHGMGATRFGKLLLQMIAKEKDARPDAIRALRQLEKVRHELFRPTSSAVITAVEMPQGEGTPQGLFPTAAPSDAPTGSDAIPTGEAPLVSEEHSAAVVASSEADPAVDAGEHAPALRDGAVTPPPPRNWAKLFVLVVGPAVLLALLAGVWLRYVKESKPAAGDEGRAAAMAPADVPPERRRRPATMATMATMAPRAIAPRPMVPPPERPVAPMAAMKPEPAMDRPTPRPAAAGPSVDQLKKECRKLKGAKTLYRKALRSARKPEGHAFARSAFRALMQCKGSRRWQRRNSAKKLAELLVFVKRCEDARAAWKTYVEMLPTKKRKRRAEKAMPPCPSAQ